VSKKVVSVAVLKLASGDPGAVREFPFLKPFSVKRKPGCCGGSSVVDHRRALTAILILTPNRLKSFKRLVGATELEVSVVRAARLVTVVI
jgi:hypothetical protein